MIPPNVIDVMLFFGANANKVAAQVVNGAA